MQNSSEPLIRKITDADFNDVVEVHIKAFPKSFLTKIGKGAVLRYYRWQYFGPHEHLFIIVELDGKIVGFCVGGVSRGALIGFLKKNMLYLFIKLTCQFWLLFNKEFFAKFKYALKLLMRKIFTSSENQSFSKSGKSFGILAICVIPDVQGKNVAKILMIEGENEALKSGFESMHLTVASDNFRAIRFYEKLGYVKVPEKCSNSSTFMEKKLIMK